MNPSRHPPQGEHPTSFTSRRVPTVTSSTMELPLLVRPKRSSRVFYRLRAIRNRLDEALIVILMVTFILSIFGGSLLAIGVPGIIRDEFDCRITNIADCDPIHSKGIVEVELHNVRQLIDLSATPITLNCNEPCCQPQYTQNITLHCWVRNDKLEEIDQNDHATAMIASFAIALFFFTTLCFFCSFYCSLLCLKNPQGEYHYY